MTPGARDDHDMLLKISSDVTHMVESIKDIQACMKEYKKRMWQLEIRTTKLEQERKIFIGIAAFVIPMVSGLVIWILNHFWG